MVPQENGLPIRDLWLYLINKKTPTIIITISTPRTMYYDEQDHTRQSATHNKQPMECRVLASHLLQLLRPVNGRSMLPDASRLISRFLWSYFYLRHVAGRQELSVAAVVFLLLLDF